MIFNTVGNTVIQKADSLEVNQLFDLYIILSSRGVRNRELIKLITGYQLIDT